MGAEMETNRYLRMQGPAYPYFIGAGQSVYAPHEAHEERIFPTFVAMFVMEGTLYLTEEGREYEVEKGGWFIQTAGLRHYGHRPADKRLVFYWVHFMPAGPWSIVSDADHAPVQYKLLDYGDGVRVPDWEMRIGMQYPYFPLEKWRRLLDGLGDPFCRRNVLLAQSRFMRLLFGMQELEMNRLEPEGHRLAGEMHTYLSRHFTRPIPMEELSAYFHFSPDYLTRCFRARYGIPPSECLMQLRMEHAKRMLFGTQRLIREIAEEVGYADSSVFSRAFRNYQGLSPYLYRRKMMPG